MIAHFLSGDWSQQAPIFERVRILERVTNANGNEELRVQLAPNNQTTIELAEDDNLHKDAQFICVALFGAPESDPLTVTYVDLSNCPLPTSSTMPLSGRTSGSIVTGKKTFRSMSGSGASGTSTAPFPKREVGFSKSK